jgi:predicted DNA-binding transcriptional regulator AlpA
MNDVSAPQPLAGKIGTVSRIMGVSPSTVRRRLNDDPEFPKPFRLSDEGDLLWPLAEVRAYLERKAGRPLAA